MVFFSIVHQTIYSSSPVSADKCFKFLVFISLEIGALSDGIYKIASLCLLKGRNFTRGDNSGKTKNKKFTSAS